MAAVCVERLEPVNIHCHRSQGCRKSFSLAPIKTLTVIKSPNLRCGGTSFKTTCCINSGVESTGSRTTLRASNFTLISISSSFLMILLLFYMKHFRTLLRAEQGYFHFRIYSWAGKLFTDWTLVCFSCLQLEWSETHRPIDTFLTFLLLCHHFRARIQHSSGIKTSWSFETQVTEGFTQFAQRN